MISFLDNVEPIDNGPQPYEPELKPVSMIDVDRMPPMDMDIHMSDPCPMCGGHNMQVGDYVCWGVCQHCATEELARV